MHLDRARDPSGPRGTIRRVPDSDPAPGHYRHFKGGEYEVLGVARHSETEERLVVYRPVGSDQLWVRPVAMFIEEVDRPEGRVPRFRRDDADAGLAGY